MTTLVNHYGLHTEGNMTFVMEKGRSFCITPGFWDLPAPFAFSAKLGECPHHLPDRPINHAIKDHPALEHVGPGAPPEVLFIRSKPMRRLLDSGMSRMFGSNELKAQPIWGVDIRRLPYHLLVTNVSPVIIFACEFPWFAKINQIAKLDRRRPLIFSGDFRPPGTTEIVIGDIDPPKDWAEVGSKMLYDLAVRNAQG